MTFIWNNNKKVYKSSIMYTKNAKKKRQAKPCSHEKKGQALMT